MRTGWVVFDMSGPPGNKDIVGIFEDENEAKGFAKKFSLYVLSAPFDPYKEELAKGQLPYLVRVDPDGKRQTVDRCNVAQGPVIKFDAGRLAIRVMADDPALALTEANRLRLGWLRDTLHPIFSVSTHNPFAVMDLCCFFNQCLYNGLHGQKETSQAPWQGYQRLDSGGPVRCR